MNLAANGLLCSTGLPLHFPLEFLFQETGPRGPAPIRECVCAMCSARWLCDAPAMFSGACLCGALRYEVQGPVQHLVHCHCSMCRKHHGAPFASIVVAPLKQLRWLAGESSVKEYASSPGRLRCFCGTCGAVAPTPLGERILVPAGNLTGDLSHLEALHLFVASKAPWHVIADELPQHDAVPSGWNMREVALPAAVQLEGATHGSCLCGSVTFSVSGPPSRWLQCHC